MLDNKETVFYFLPDDLKWLDLEIERVRELIKTAKELGQESTEQSSESWHDNYNFEESQRLLKMYFNILGGLSKAREKSLLVTPPTTPETVAVGTTVEYSKVDVARPGKPITDTISIGSYMVSETLRDLDFVSYESPLGQALLGLENGATRIHKVGESTFQFTVLSIASASRLLEQSE